ncbi:LppU/SCO3897 family protein [Micromonospora carbonacea]|uniref:LppU/SCO3897 family protein n=1 Tax=Micromonospora carbonacea TaxID=47853 RepID=UPI0033D6FC58
MPEPVAQHPAAPPEDAPRPADPPAARDPEQPESGQPGNGPAVTEAAQVKAESAQVKGETGQGGRADEPGAGAAEPQDGQDGQAEGGQVEPRRSVVRKVVGVVAALLAVGVVAALKFGLGGAVAAALDEDATAKAKTGDCLAELPDVAEGERKDARGAEVVACTSTEAVYTVVGRLDGQTEAQARTGEACEPFLQPGQAGYFFYNIKPGSTGYLLCLTRKAA